MKVLLPFADVFFTGPISIITGVAIHRHMKWGYKMGLVVSGIYIFGSVLVFISMLWTKNYAWYLSVPALIGFAIGLGFKILILQNTSKGKNT